MTSAATNIQEARDRRERVLWPAQSIENEQKTGAYVSRLYPFIGRDGRNDGAVMTPKGQGTLLQAFSSGCSVQMLRGWATGKNGERHRPVLTFAPEDVVPHRPGRHS